MDAEGLLSPRPVATVVVPTHDHGPLLGRSLRSARTQSVAELEIFVVGDGVPDVTRELVAEAARADPRIRFFDNPKGPRHGELHRHAALGQARGRIVCYLADDDLWCPDHVAELETLLARADFASSVAVEVELSGSLFPWLGALEDGAFRTLMRAGINFLPLSAVGHTLALYRALPFGWRTTPEGIPTDLHMWQQLLAQPGLSAASGSRPTAIRFGASPRRGWTLEDRLAELEQWTEQLAAPRWLTLEPLLRKRYASAGIRVRRHLSRLGEEPGAFRRRIALELWKHEARRARVRFPAR